GGGGGGGGGGVGGLGVSFERARPARAAGGGGAIGVSGRRRGAERATPGGGAAIGPPGTSHTRRPRLLRRRVSLRRWFRVTCDPPHRTGSARRSGHGSQALGRVVARAVDRRAAGE